MTSSSPRSRNRLRRRHLLAAPVLTLVPSAAAARDADEHWVRQLGLAASRTAAVAPAVDAVTVGQLFMTGTSATQVDAATRTAIARHHVGNVMLRGRSDAGVAATARVTRTLRGLATRRATGGRRMLVATDQEGGLVQVLTGPGFSAIPTALEQGRLSDAALRRRATRWGRELRAAGINLNLGPVLDTVPSPAFAPRNAPIGAFHRQFGYRPAQVARSGTAVMRGMRAARVAPVVKHFPGLGRVTANTDTTADVHDRTTTADDAYLEPFRVAVAAGAPVVMVSSATYDRIDPHRLACFSRPVVTGLLRGELGFTGVVISDDLSDARAVQGRTPAERALMFLRAGGDLVLALDPAHVPAMTGAVLREARRDPAFARRVQQAIARVEALKARYA